MFSETPAPRCCVTLLCGREDQFRIVAVLRWPPSAGGGLVD